MAGIDRRIVKMIFEDQLLVEAMTMDELLFGVSIRRGTARIAPEDFFESPLSETPNPVDN